KRAMPAKIRTLILMAKGRLWMAGECRPGSGPAPPDGGRVRCKQDARRRKILREPGRPLLQPSAARSFHNQGNLYTSLYRDRYLFPLICEFGNVGIRQARVIGSNSAFPIEEKEMKTWWKAACSATLAVLMVPAVFAQTPQNATTSSSTADTGSGM